MCLTENDSDQKCLDDRSTVPLDRRWEGPSQLLDGRWLVCRRRDRSGQPVRAVFREVELPDCLGAWGRLGVYCHLNHQLSRLNDAGGIEENKR